MKPEITLRRKLHRLPETDTRKAFAELLASGLLLRELRHSNAGWKALDTAMRALGLPENAIDSLREPAAAELVRACILGIASADLVSAVPD